MQVKHGTEDVHVREEKAVLVAVGGNVSALIENGGVRALGAAGTRGRAAPQVNGIGGPVPRALRDAAGHGRRMQRVTACRCRRRRGPGAPCGRPAQGPRRRT